MLKTLHWAQIMALDVKRKLMVMPSNNSAAIVHFWAGRYEGRIGWLVGPSAMKSTKLRPWIPFACDNDAFASFTTGKPQLRKSAAYRRILESNRESDT